MIDTFLFDLDGTLYQLDHEDFGVSYFKDLATIAVNNGYDKDIFLKGMKLGIAAMKDNDGSATNKAAYERAFTAATGYDVKKIETLLNAYYATDFKHLERTAKKNEAMQKSIKLLKSAGFKLILATDPLFPECANLERMRWAGLDPEDFIHIPAYDKHSFAKPSPGFFFEALKYGNSTAGTAMMVGNSVYNDVPSIKAGIPCYLVEDDLLNEENIEFETAYRSSMQGFYEFVVKLTGTNA